MIIALNSKNLDRINNESVKKLLNIAVEDCLTKIEDMEGIWYNPGYSKSSNSFVGVFILKENSIYYVYHCLDDRYILINSYKTLGGAMIALDKKHKAPYSSKGELKNFENLL